MAPRWSDAEWDTLFDAYPPVRGRMPDLAVCEDLGRRLGRTPHGVQWMWQDAEHHLRDGRSLASQRLVEYLRRRGFRPAP